MPLYEEIEIEDMTYDSEAHTYSYPCPCGDRFKVSLEDLWDGEDIADCQSCTLFIKVVYEESDLPPPPRDDDEDGGLPGVGDETEGEKPRDDGKEQENGRNDADNQGKDDITKAVETLSISSQ
jgi:diphthamide biosynthesis protein 3